MVGRWTAVPVCQPETWDEDGASGRGKVGGSVACGVA
jgi:hypothetical protein